MQPIPGDILTQFETVLKKRAVPASRHADYRKWLRYYLDFRSKYTLPYSRSEHVRLFIEKLRKKNQTPEQQKQAAHALSLFFESENAETKATTTTPVAPFTKREYSNNVSKPEATTVMSPPGHSDLKPSAPHASLSCHVSAPIKKTPFRRTGFLTKSLLVSFNKSLCGVSRPSRSHALRPYP
jgi:hypothetical protein